MKNLESYFINKVIIIIMKIIITTTRVRGISQAEMAMPVHQDIHKIRTVLRLRLRQEENCHHHQEASVNLKRAETKFRRRKCHHLKSKLYFFFSC